MAIPSYGAAPVARIFLIVRALQLVCFAGIIGITASFISEIVATNHTTPREILGTIAVASLACLYCLLSIPLFLAQASHSLLVMSLLDFLLLIAFVVVSVVLGKPLASISCPLITSDPNGLLHISDAYDFTQSLSNSVNRYSSFVAWSGASKSNCLSSKAAWGMCVAACILFGTSAIILPALHVRFRRVAKAAP